MGAWNTKIESNDEYLNVKETFFGELKETNDINQAIANTIIEFVGIDEYYDIQMFIALADGTIEAGMPNKKIIQKAINFIENGKDEKCYIDSASRKQDTLKWISRVKKYLN